VEFKGDKTEGKGWPGLAQEGYLDSEVYEDKQVKLADGARLQGTPGVNCGIRKTRDRVKVTNVARRHHIRMREPLFCAFIVSEHTVVVCFQKHDISEQPMCHLKSISCHQWYIHCTLGNKAFTWTTKIFYI
jgi:hypothetical protein